ncbi:MAG: hypothetical protein LUD84_10480 [Clostridiales bacterium]|nr:hypothetical protein [Clostridiales bacterium]
MSSNQNLFCPVCGRPRSAGSTSYGCENCGFQSAYVNGFVSEESCRAWGRMVDEAKAARRKKLRETFPSIGSLHLNKDSVVFVHKEEQKAYIISQYGELRVEEQVAQYSRSDSRHYAILRADGTVKVVGDDNIYGQKNTGSWKNITHVLAAARCTYGVKQDGSVIAAGSSEFPRISTWKNIVQLACGADVIVGLQSNGQVLVDSPSPVVPFPQVKNWRNIKTVAVSRGGILGLRTDGRVLFAGKKADDIRNRVQNWAGIIAVAVDTSVVYGLSQDGSVSMVGSRPPALDRGRIEAARWQNIVALSCSQTGVGAINDDGALLLAGWDASAQVMAAWDKEIRPRLSL